MSKVSDELVRKVAQMIARQELQRPFIKDFVEYGGYPIWEKALVTNNLNSMVYTRGGNEAEHPNDIIIIPFTLENGSSLNATLTVGMFARDTTFQMVYKWQYAKNGYDEIPDGNNADQTALFFMGYESYIFGHHTFILNDNQLLQGQRESDTLTIQSFDGNEFNAKMSMINITTCAVQRVRCSTREPYKQLLNEKANAFGYCVDNVCSSYTLMFWEDDNMIPGGDTWENTGGGGGGVSNDAGWSDNPCNVGFLPSGRRPPCGEENPPAWVPLPIEEIEVEEAMVWNYLDHVNDITLPMLDLFSDNKPFFQFLPEDSIQKKYPKFTELVKNLKSFVMSNKAVWGALKNWSGLSDGKIIEYLSYGQGPIIKVKDFIGAFGYFNQLENPSVLNIRKYYVDKYEDALNFNLKYKQSLSFLLAVTILHEFVHFGAFVNELDDNRPKEYGFYFEQEALGMEVGTNNMSQVYIKFKEFF